MSKVLHSAPRCAPNDGVVDALTKALGKLAIAESVPEGLSADLNLELRGRATLIEAIQMCEHARDFISREIVKEILDDTEEHIDFLETQLSILASIGLDNYLQLQAHPANGG